jgi:UDP-N-acetylglucosamine acyltransferase
VIHKTAIVDSKAKISDNVEIGPYCIIGPEVEIGVNSILYSHVNIVGNTKIGNNNQIYPFSSIGTPPQDLKFKGEKNSLIIGNNNKFREYVNINPGTEQGGGITRIGDNNLLMVYCHVAHDCTISNNIVLANNVQVGGHVNIQNNAIVGGSCAIHQFSRIGESAMVGGMTGVLSDVIPFGLSMGNRNNLTGLNLIGLRRSKVSNENIKKIQLAYEIIFKTPSFRENIEELNSDLKNNVFVKKILNFINSDKKRPMKIRLKKQSKAQIL